MHDQRARAQVCAMLPAANPPCLRAARPAGLRPRNLDAKALLAIFELLQNHYPERLSR